MLVFVSAVLYYDTLHGSKEPAPVVSDHYRGIYTVHFPRAVLCKIFNIFLFIYRYICATDMCVSLSGAVSWFEPQLVPFWWVDW